MNFLATLIADIAAAFMKMLGADIADYVKKREAIAAAQAQAVADAKISVQPLKDAKDGKAIDDSTDGALNGT